MTWTYGNDPGTTTAAQRRDAVRLTVGDTAEPPTAQVNATSLTDEEIAYFLSNTSNDILGSALAAVDALMGKWTRKPQVSHGPSSVNPAGILDMLERLRGILSARVGMEAPWFAGGLTISGKQGLRDDTDAVQPAFARGMDAIRGTDTDTGGASYEDDDV